MARSVFWIGVTYFMLLGPGTGNLAAAVVPNDEGRRAWIAESADTDADVVSFAELTALMERPTLTGEPATVVLALSGLRVVPGTNGTFIGRSDGTSVIACVVEPSPELSMSGTALMLLASNDSRTIPVIFDITRSDVRADLLGTGAAARISNGAGGVEKIDSFAPMRYRNGSSPRVMPNAIVANSFFDKLKCIVDQFGFSGDAICAAGEYVFCVTTAQFPTTSAGALVGCARPILKALLKESKQASSWCAAVVDIMKCLTDGGPIANGRPTVSISSLNISGSRIALRAIASDKDSNLRAISVVRNNMALVAGSPSDTCWVDSSGASATCNALLDVGSSPTSVDLTVTATDVYGLSASTGVNVPMRFTISGNAGTGNVAMAIGSATYAANAQGAYSVSGMAPGTYTVVPSKSRCTFTPSSLRVTVGPSATAQNFKASCK